MIVDHADALHERVADGAADKFESALFQILAHLVADVGFTGYLFGCFPFVDDGFAVDKLPDVKVQSLVIDFFFLVKHKSAGKIESHLWFFKGFCTYLQPKLTQLIDVGTLPLRNSISRMAIYMDMEKQVGGVCGEIEVMVPDRMGWLGSALVSAQYVEYKVSSYMD